MNECVVLCINLQDNFRRALNVMNSFFLTHNMQTNWPFLLCLRFALLIYFWTLVLIYLPFILRLHQFNNAKEGYFCTYGNMSVQNILLILITKLFLTIFEHFYVSPAVILLQFCGVVVKRIVSPS